MISIGNMYTDLSKYEEGKDDYYTKTPGEWHGQGADRQGLSGEIDKETFTNLRAGKNADGRVQDVPLGVNGTHDEGRDLTFSAPKGVSMLREFAGREVREAIDRAWTGSVDRTMQHVEEKFIVARVMRNGEKGMAHTGNMTYATFGHEVSRDLDMQLHTHCPVMNKTWNAEAGKWQAIEFKNVLDNKIYIGQYQRNEFALNLKTELSKLGYDVQITTDSKGLWDITTFSKEEVKAFSQGSQRIQEALKEIKEKFPNASEAEQKAMANLATRPEKNGSMDIAQVRREWNERGEKMGITREAVTERLQQQTAKSREMQPELRHTEYDVIRQAAKITTESESRFEKETLLKIAGKLGVGEFRMGDLERAFNELHQDKEFVHLGHEVDRQGAKTHFYTTPEMQKLERQNIEIVRAENGKADAMLTPQKAEKALEAYQQKMQEGNPNFKFTPGQKEAGLLILTSKNVHVGLQGDAGTGKTTLFNAVREIAEKEGYKVMGLAYTGKAASELQEKSGVQSQTLHRALQSGDLRYSPRQIWIVDEKSFVGSKQANELLKAARECSAKVVMAGDTKQGQAIAAGRPFADMQQSGALETIRLKDNVRQKGELAEYVREAAEKDISGAMARLEKQGRVHEIKDRDQRIDAITKEYLSRDNPKDTLIVTSRNADRNGLNARIHEALRDKGDLTGKEQVFTVRESKNLSPEERHFAQSYEPGDLICTTKFGVAGKSGNILTVTDKDDTRHEVRAVDKTGREHTISVREDGDKIAAYREKEQGFCAGEKVVFLKNDHALQVKNGQTGEVASVSRDGHMAVKMENGQERSFNTAQYNYLDHGYAVTNPKSQGQTSQHTIFHADTTKGMDYNQFYVGTTRQQHDLSIFTDDKGRLVEEAAAERVKTSTLDPLKHDQERDAADHAREPERGERDGKEDRSSARETGSGKEAGYQRQEEEQSQEIGMDAGGAEGGE